MNKLDSWLVTLIGVLLLLPLISVDIGIVSNWIITVAVLIIGIASIAKKA